MLDAESLSFCELIVSGRSFNQTKHEGVGIFEKYLPTQVKNSPHSKAQLLWKKPA